MKACESHNESIVIFNEDVCPLCKAEKKFTTIMEEVQKSIMIMKQIQMTAEEAGVKSD
jgi:predicted DCC family thiol-disulfide oxidoreductase YuxK